VSERLDALRAMAAEDPTDLLARYLLGKECLGAGLLDEAIANLEHYVERHAGDRGAAYGALASAFERAGRNAEAREALRRGIANAEEHRHRQLAEELSAELERLS
jgi:thioredoxin-like negative regulator of GroEL